MESRIKAIQEKYWAGESTIEEERLLKAYYNKNRDAGAEADYFKQIQQSAKLKSPISFQVPDKKTRLPKWLAIAAVSIGIIFSVSIIRSVNQQDEFLVDDPQEAMRITRQALMTISSGMNKGNSYAEAISKFDDAKTAIKYQ